MFFKFPVLVVFLVSKDKIVTIAPYDWRVFPLSVVAREAIFVISDARCKKRSSESIN